MLAPFTRKRLLAVEGEDEINFFEKLQPLISFLNQLK